MFPHLVGDPQGVVDPESSPPIPLFSLRGQLALPTCCVPGSVLGAPRLPVPSAGWDLPHGELTQALLMGRASTASPPRLLCCSLCPQGTAGTDFPVPVFLFPLLIVEHW